MINKTSLKAMRKELEEYDKAREKVIIKSREILKNSKSAIYALHRKDHTKANKLLKTAKKGIQQIKKITKKDWRLMTTGTYHDALEEYCEAESYSQYLKNKKIPTQKQLNVDAQTYLGALCDLTGELTRKAINDAINGEYKTVQEIRETIKEIYNELSLLDWRNLAIRRKYDSIKYGLEKIEDIILKIKLEKR
ncbi:hypothetical protein DRJ22_01895 [Candidatus Woesearchaeota archaeon]|nr:MAG: hypothetical protein DRJ22_01895 [Candidatus Woesearchaeota archaeon]